MNRAGINVEIGLAGGTVLAGYQRENGHDHLGASLSLLSTADAVSRRPEEDLP